MYDLNQYIGKAMPIYIILLTINCKHVLCPFKGICSFFQISLIKVTFHTKQVAFTLSS